MTVGGRIMCGRITLRASAGKLSETFQVADWPQLFPRFNIAPTQLILCVRALPDDPASREVVPMKWGLIPGWAHDPAIGNRMINARAETVAEKPSFRTAFKKRRCLIPADGFYEWEKTPEGKKQPWLIGLPGDAPFAFAGLWEEWHPASDGTSDPVPSVLSCTILTTSANAEMQPIHDRMPVILRPDDHAVWLNAGPHECLSLLKPLPDGTLHRHRVSVRVNNPRNESAECVLAITHAS